MDNETETENDFSPWIKCPDCKGKGYFFFPRYSPLPAPCEMCVGHGSISRETYNNLFKVADNEEG